jgi:hypothetical protein
VLTHIRPMANRTKLTPHACARFLERLRATSNVAGSARAIGMSRRGIYDAKERDPEFSAAWDDAVETACDRLEAEAWRRGVEGVEEPIISMGKVVRDKRGKPMVRRQYSDHLMIALLKAHRPEKYRENVNLSGTVMVELSSRIDAAIKRREQFEAEERRLLPAPTVIDVEPESVPASRQGDLND